MTSGSLDCRLEKKIEHFPKTNIFFCLFQLMAFVGGKGFLQTEQRPSVCVYWSLTNIRLEVFETSLFSAIKNN